MTLYSVKQALEIWINGYIAGIGTAFILVMIYVCYESYKKQEQKKKRELKKYYEEILKQKKKGKRGRKK